MPNRHSINKLIIVFVLILVCSPQMLFADTISDVVTISAYVVPTTPVSPASDTTGRGTIINMPTVINFSGRTQIFSKVLLFKDGKYIDSVETGRNNNFYLSLTVYDTNIYNFILYGEDVSGKRTIPFSIDVYTKKATIINISNINLLNLTKIDNVVPANSCSHLIADLNCDNKVNLIDYSIMVYWMNKVNPPKKVDLNHDGKISLIDFSIMMYHWTGQ